MQSIEAQDTRGKTFHFIYIKFFQFSQCHYKNTTRYEGSLRKWIFDISIPHFISYRVTISMCCFVSLFIRKICFTLSKQPKNNKFLKILSVNNRGVAYALYLLFSMLHYFCDIVQDEVCMLCHPHTSLKFCLYSNEIVYIFSVDWCKTHGKLLANVMGISSGR